MSATEKKQGNYIDLNAPMPLTAFGVEEEMVLLESQAASIESQIEIAEARERSGERKMDQVWHKKARASLRLTKARIDKLKLQIRKLREHPLVNAEIEHAMAFKEVAVDLFDQDDLRDVYDEINKRYPHLRDLNEL